MAVTCRREHNGMCHSAIKSSFPVDVGQIANLSSRPGLVAGLEGRQHRNSGHDAGCHPAIRSSIGRLSAVTVPQLFSVQPPSHPQDAFIDGTRPRTHVFIFPGGQRPVAATKTGGRTATGRGTRHWPYHPEKTRRAQPDQPDRRRTRWDADVRLDHGHRWLSSLGWEGAGGTLATLVADGKVERSRSLHGGQSFLR